MYPQPRRSANGAVILVLGILAIISLGCLTGIPAWIMGNNSLREIEAGMADPSERGLVQAGRVLGIIATLLMAAGLLFFLCIVLFAGALSFQRVR